MALTIFSIPRDIYRSLIFPFLDDISFIFFKHAVFNRALPSKLVNNTPPWCSIFSHSLSFFRYCSKHWPALKCYESLCQAARSVNFPLVEAMIAEGYHASQENITSLAISAIDSHDIQIFNHIQKMFDRYWHKNIDVPVICHHAGKAGDLSC